MYIKPQFRYELLNTYTRSINIYIYYLMVENAIWLDIAQVCVRIFMNRRRVKIQHKSAISSHTYYLLNHQILDLLYTTLILVASRKQEYIIDPFLSIRFPWYHWRSSAEA